MGKGANPDTSLAQLMQERRAHASEMKAWTVRPRGQRRAAPCTRRDDSQRLCPPYAQRSGHERRRHHLRLPAQHLRVRGDPSPGAGRGPARDRRLQYLRGDRRGGAAIASGHPPAQARAADGAHRGHGLRGADRAWTLRGHARGRAGPGQRGEAQRPGLARAPGRAGASRRSASPPRRRSPSTTS